MFMVFNTTFNNFTAISWRSVLLVEDTEVPEENSRPARSHWQIVYRVHLVMSGNHTHNFGGDTITTITTPLYRVFWLALILSIMYGKTVD